MEALRELYGHAILAEQFLILAFVALVLVASMVTGRGK